MKQINDQLTITEVFEYDDELSPKAEAHFVYMEQFHCTAWFRKNRDSFSSVESQGLPASMHDAILEEIEDNIDEIVAFIATQFDKEEEE